MKIGMMWLDDDKKLSLEQKISRAADYYQHKYGCTPDLCLVNKSMLDQEKSFGKIKVRPAGNVLPNHFWLGIR